MQRRGNVSLKRTKEDRGETLGGVFVLELGL